jgi:hypothetical protein
MSTYPTIYTLSTSPQVILGSNTTGLGADDALLGFRKYNSHTHLYSTSTNFYTYGISPGNVVYVYDDDGVPLFSESEPPAIEYISASQVRLNTTSTRSLDNRLFIVKPVPDSEELVVIVGISLRAGHSLIEFSPDVPRQGHVSNQVLDGVLKEQIGSSYSLSGLTAGAIIPVALFTEHGWIESTSLKLVNATATVKLQIKQFHSNYSLPPTTYSTESITLTDGTVIDYSFVEQAINSEAMPFSGFLSKSLQTPFMLELLVESVVLGTNPSLVTSSCISSRLN